MATLTRLFGYLYRADGTVVKEGTLTLRATEKFVSVDGTTVIPAPISLNLLPLDTPSGVAISNQGTAGATTYGYRIAALDAAGEETLASATVSTATGNATLSGANFNRISWTAVDGAASYNVYGRTNGFELLLATVSVATYDDTGSATPSSALPSANTTGGYIQQDVYANVGASPAGTAYLVEYDADPDDTTKPIHQKSGFWRNYWSVPQSGTVPLGNFVQAHRGEPLANYMPVGATVATADVTLTLGGVAEDTTKRILANQAGATKPEIRYSYIDSEWQLSHDGVTFETIATPSVGDITGVTAGSGLTGGGTSGTISLAVTNLTNAHIDNAAAIAYSKLSLATSILNSDISASAAIDWTKISKTGSSLADLATRSATDLSSGTLPDARFPATLPALSGVNLTALNATNLASGTIPDARFPATLPAISGANLTNLNATALTGTVASARVAGAYTGITGLGTLSAGLAISGGGYVGWTGSAGAYIRGGSTDGRIRLLNAAENGFDMLQLGGTSSSFPAIKRSGSLIHIRLADDSNYAAVRASYLQLNNGSYISDSADGVINLYNAAGTDVSRLTFGGTTSAFPAIKRNSAGLRLRLADDSADADLTLRNIVATGNDHSFGPLATNGNTIYPVSDNYASLGSSGNKFLSANLSQYLAIGANPASAGAIRLANNSAIYWRNAANTSDLGWTLNASDSLVASASVIVNSGIYAPSGASLPFGASFTTQWRISTAGHLLAEVDNTYDIGASGATRPRSIYAGTVVVAGGSITSGANFFMPAAGALNAAGRSTFKSPGDGVWTLFNNAETDFSRLQFGGTTSAFPSIKRNGAMLELRLADDSAFASMRMQSMYFDNGSTNATISHGTGSPEGVVSANVGSIWLRSNGGAGTSVYVKETGAGNTGWSVIGAGATHNLLSATHADSTAAVVQRGDLITGQGASATWSRLGKGAANTVLMSDGTDLAWSSNVPLLNAANNFTGTMQFGGATAELTATTDNLRLNANGSVIFGIDRDNNSGSEAFYWRINNATDVMTLSEAGLLSVSGAGTHLFSAASASSNQIGVRNTTSGTGAYAALQIGNDIAAAQGEIAMFSSGYTTSGFNHANSLRIYSAGAGGMSIVSGHASGGIRFYSGGSTLRGEVLAGGTLMWQAGIEAGAGAAAMNSTGFYMGTWGTTATAANANVANGNYLRLVTSLRSSKHDIQPIDSDYARRVVMGLQGVTYRSAVDEDQRQWAGFIADDAEQVDPILSTYDEDGALQSFTYDRVPAFLVPVIQAHEKELAQYKSRIEALEAKMAEIFGKT